eukprot:2457894-Pleurochrysis_carterae.AAC.1
MFSGVQGSKVHDNARASLATAQRPTDTSLRCVLPWRVRMAAVARADGCECTCCAMALILSPTTLSAIAAALRRANKEGGHTGRDGRSEQAGDGANTGGQVASEHAQ